MTIEEIFQKQNFDEQLAELTKIPEKDEYRPEVDIARNYKEYYGNHLILAKLDKTIGEGDNKKIIPLVKIITKFQKKIVQSAIGFLFGRPVSYIQKSKETESGKAFTYLNATMYGNKTEIFDRKLARAIMIETRAAELWYVNIDDAAKTKTVGVILLCSKTGNEIFPYFDETGKMVAFTRKFKINNIQHAEIYTADKIIKAKNIGVGWEVIPAVNPYGKIPVVYYEQEEPEWADVQTLIDRFETVISNHGDTNDYNGAPILKAFGKVADLPDKSATGKFLQFEAMEIGIDGKPVYGDASYLTWDQSPASIKLELDNLNQFIYSLSSTPNLAFDNLKGIGNVAGVALKLMFLDSIIKAANEEEIYSEGLMRRVNVLKAILSATESSLSGQFEKLSIQVKFNSILPENTAEMITILSQARGGEAVMSEETAVRNNPLVEDAENEIELLKTESQSGEVKQLQESYGI